jgi:hypothetical protein
MDNVICGIEATTLTPFTYHSLAVDSGTTTIPDLISDTAIAFGLGATLGKMNCSVALPERNYKQHWRELVWRSSIFSLQSEPRLLSPMVRRLSLDGEGGYQKNIRTANDSGNLKTYFQTQEVPAGQIYTGCLFGIDPFKAFKHDYFVIRIGLHRNGLLKLVPKKVENIRLNASTAALFNPESQLPVNRYLLHSLQLSPEMLAQDALQEVMTWK